jgi:21S rRNA (uridine2791-2'-O)-methyltransferase
MIRPNGRVLGVDLIPAQPPRGVSTIQGDFLSPDVQASIRSFLRDPNRGRTLRPLVYADMAAGQDAADEVAVDAEAGRGYVDRERRDLGVVGGEEVAVDGGEGTGQEKTVDVVLSDMCEPWEQTSGFFNRTLSDPYLRMMNTSGNNFRDHAGSMVSGCALFSLPVSSRVSENHADVMLGWVARISAGRCYSSASIHSKSAVTSSASFTRAPRIRPLRSR